MKVTRFGAALAALVVLAAVSSAAATGTFAGANGRIAFTMRTETGDFDVYTMKPDGTGVVQVTSDPGRDFNPRWSPDGKRIAFSSNRDGDFDIWTVMADGTGLMRVTGLGTDPNLDAVPAWTADGKQIVFQRRFADEIWIANADGSGAEMKVADGILPATSPRGRKIVYTGRSDLHLHILNLGDGTTQTLAGTAFDAEVNWSPTGNDLVFSGAASLNDEFFDTYVMHADGSQLSGPLTDFPAPFQGGSPVWSPDGARIAIAVCDFPGGIQNNCSIQTIKPDGTDPTPIAIQGVLDRVGGRIDWQPLPKN
jgi:Tol biopolymer transport system component